MFRYVALCSDVEMVMLAIVEANYRIVVSTSFPKVDCSLLPIVHTSAEELAIYIVRGA